MVDVERWRSPVDSEVSLSNGPRRSGILPVAAVLSGPTLGTEMVSARIGRKRLRYLI
jgi:hypothetical protein